MKLAREELTRGKIVAFALGLLDKGSFVALLCPDTFRQVCEQMLRESQWTDAVYKHLPFIFNEENDRTDESAISVGRVMMHEDMQKVCRVLTDKKYAAFEQFNTFQVAVGRLRLYQHFMAGDRFKSSRVWVEMAPWCQLPSAYEQEGEDGHSSTMENRRPFCRFNGLSAYLRDVGGETGIRDHVADPLYFSDGMQLLDHANDLLFQIESMGGCDIIREVAPWVAELFLMQMFMFPGSEEENYHLTISHIHMPPDFYCFDGATVLFDLCHEYGCVNTRKMSTWEVCATVQENGSTVEITFSENEIGELSCIAGQYDCPCNHCKTFLIRHPGKTGIPDHPVDWAT